MGKYEYGSRCTLSELGAHESLMAETGPGGSLPAVYALEVATDEVADPETAGARYREERDGAGEGTVVTSVVVSAALAGALLGAGRLGTSVRHWHVSHRR